MEQSDKHNPRIDEQLAHDQQSFLKGAPVDSRVQEQRRESDGPLPGQPSAATQVPGREQGTSEGLDSFEVDLRSELATYLDGSIFPADRQQLLDDARSHNAPRQVINLIDRLPSGEQYDRVQAVWEAANR